MPKVEMEAEEANPEVVEVLAEVPKSLRTSRPNLTPSKENIKVKKCKQPTILVCASQKRNPLKPTAHEKGKAISLEPKDEDIEDIPMDDEDVGVEVEDIETQGADPITRFLEYVRPCKPKTKVPKDIDESKNPLQTPLLLDEIVFDGSCLSQVLLLNLED